MKNRAGLLALVVLAIATIFTVFVVLPMMKHGKGPVADLANQASDAVKDVAKQATEAAGDVAKTVNDATATGQSAVLEKMDRLKADAGSAVTEMQSLFAGGKVPTPEQITAAKSKAETALTAITSLPLPEGVDATLTATAKTANENATKWLGLVQAIPTDVDGAKKAIVALATAMGVAVTADMAAPAAEPAKPAETAAAPPADPNTPSFDIVRVEKDGSMVVAGRGQPGSKIQIMNGETVIASTDVDKDGNFVAVLDNPLVAGDYSLVLKTTAADGSVKTSDEVATVSVPKDANGQLLAMVTKAGEASRILTAPEAAKPADTAAATPAAATTPAASTETAAAPAAPAAAVALPDLPAAASTIAGTAPSVETPAANTPAAAASAEPAPATPAAAATTDAKPSPPDVAVSAVELEGDKIFIAGNTKPGLLVRAYADDKLVGEIKSGESGAFVVEGTLALSVGKHTIRTDVIDDKGAVAFRATVPFDRPEGEDVAVVASNDIAPGAAPAMAMLGDGKFDQLRTEAAKALDLVKSLFAGGKVPTGEQLAAGRSSLQFALASLADFKLPDNADATSVSLVSKVAAGAADALKLLKGLPQDAAGFGAALATVENAVNAVVAPHTGADAAKTAEAAPAATAAPAADATQAAAPAAVTPATTEAAKPATADAAPAAAAASTTPAETAAPAASSAKAETAASADAGKATAEPKITAQAPLKESKTSVIIRHGDTLWQISRRVYGRGIRYTTIYLANQDQIANPDVIEPGQIFGVPDKSVPDVDAEAIHRKHLLEKK